MASGRLRIGYPAPGSVTMSAAYGSYALTGQAAALSYSGASDLYLGVDASGNVVSYANDITIYAGPAAVGSGDGSSEANAMSWATAKTTAVAGDVIGLLPGAGTGAYMGTGQSDKTDPAHSLTNNGTSGNPIIVVAKYSAINLAGKSNGGRWSESDMDAVFAHANRTEFRHNGTSDGDGQGTASPSFGSVFGQTDQWWFGIAADQEHNELHEDGGVVAMWGGTRCKVARCVIYGRPAPYTSFPTDNHCGIRCEDYVNVECYDNVIYNFLESTGGAGSARNHCGIQRYAHSTDAVGLRLRHNYVFGCFNGIFLKDENNYASDEVVSYNYVDDCVNGIEIANCNPGGTAHTYAEYNLVTNCDQGFTGQQGTGINVHIRWNTMYVEATGPGTAACIDANNFGSGCEFTNNVMYGTAGNLMLESNFRSAAVSTSNYNCFYSASGFRCRHNGSNYTTIATWRTGSSQDANSVNVDPDFVNAAAFNFTPQAASVLTGSSSGGVMGHTAGSAAPGPRYT